MAYEHCPQSLASGTFCYAAVACANGADESRFIANVAVDPDGKNPILHISTRTLF
jgi:hypothetical protein